MDWKLIMFGEEGHVFIFEALLRTAIMFIIILVSLRALGKRGVKQLSVFELGVVIGLGSAAGDPMFYKEVGILQALAVFVVVLGLYKLVTFLINRSDRFEHFVAGQPQRIIKDGAFIPAALKREPVAHDELLMQLRLKQVSQLGQVEEAILETNGELSLFFYEDENVKAGLPTLLILDQGATKKELPQEGTYACCNCGFIVDAGPVTSMCCPKCDNDEWLPASSKKRIP